MMADVTRLRLLSDGITADTTRPSEVSTRQSPSTEGRHEDPTLRLCQEWQQAHNHTLVLCRKHQALEAELVRTIGFPSERLLRSDESEGKIHSIGDSPEVGSHGDEALQDQAIAQMAEHQTRWDALDDQIGYSRMDSLIRQSEAVERALLDEIVLAEVFRFYRRPHPSTLCLRSWP